MSSFSQVTAIGPDQPPRIVDEPKPPENDSASKTGKIFEKSVEAVEAGPDMVFTRESLIRNRFLMRAGRITDRQVSQAVELSRKIPRVKEFLISLLKKRRSLNRVRSRQSSITRRNREELDERTLEEHLRSMSQQNEEMAWNEADHELQERHLEHLEFNEDLRRLIVLNRYFDTTLADSMMSHAETMRALNQAKQLPNVTVPAVRKG